MKSLFKIILLTSLAIGNVYGAGIVCPKDAPYFCITPDMAPDTQIKLADFYNVPLKILSLFNDSLKNVEAPVVLDAEWESPYFGAGIAYYENYFHLKIFAGTTRVEGMTMDAYAALVCHELGHIIGGAPYQTIQGGEWSSSEGQSDFFAASVCLPKYFLDKNVSAKDIAARVEKAGYELFSSIGPYGSPKELPIERHIPFNYQVSETLINLYPSLQCRYETFRNPSKRAECWFKTTLL